MRIRSTLLGACVLVTLAGCGSTSHSVSKPTVGEIHGNFIAVGGLRGEPATPMKGEVTLTEMTTKATFRVRTGTDGRFSVAAPPGTYTAVGFTPEYMVNKRQAECHAIGAASVAAGHASILTVACQRE